MLSTLLTLVILTYEPILPVLNFTPNVVYIKVDQTKRKRLCQ